MKRIVPVLLVAGLAATTWTGCQATTGSDGAASPADTAPGAAPEYVSVTLKLPNMTCPGCAALVRGDLEKIDGVVDIQTDVEHRQCRFRVPAATVDYRARLAALAQPETPWAECAIQ